MIPVFTAAAISMSISFVVPVVTITAFQFFAASESFGETKEEVENDGFKCEVSGINSQICTKKDEKDYTCDRAKPPTCFQLFRPPKPVGVFTPTRPGGSQLAPTKDRPRFPTKVWKFQKAPVTNAPTKNKPKKSWPSKAGTMNTVPMKQYKMAPLAPKEFLILKTTWNRRQTQNRANYK